MQQKQTKFNLEYGRQILNRRGPHLNSNESFKMTQTADKSFGFVLRMDCNLLKGDMFRKGEISL